MLQIIKNLRDVHENKLHELRRMDQGIEQWVHGGRVNAVAFEVDAKGSNYALMAGRSDCG